MSTKVPKPTRRKPSKTFSTWDAIAQDNNGLSRERVVAAAVAIADQHGLSAVSIRRVASQLGSSAMALYHYVPSKRDLLNLMLDATYVEFQFPSDTITLWRGALSHFAWESRRCLKRHPWVSLLRSADPEYGPECIRVLEQLLASLAQFGLDLRTAIRIIGILFVFVNGFVALEATEPDSHQSKRQRRPSVRLPSFSKAVLATGKFPNVARFIGMGAELLDDQAFERALNWMLDGIAADTHLHTRLSAIARAK